MSILAVNLFPVVFADQNVRESELQLFESNLERNIKNWILIKKNQWDFKVPLKACLTICQEDLLKRIHSKVRVLSECQERCNRMIHSAVNTVCAEMQLSEPVNRIGQWILGTIILKIIVFGQRDIRTIPALAACLFYANKNDYRWVEYYKLQDQLGCKEKRYTAPPGQTFIKDLRDFWNSFF